MAEKGFGVKEINLIGASGTPTIESPNNLNLNAVNVAISTNATIGGNLTVTGNVGIAGTLTYEDVTNIDSVGIITARSDLNVDGHTNLDNVSIVGVATVTGSNINIEGGSASLSQLKINSTGRYRGIQLDENGTRKAHFQHDATSNNTIVGTAEGTMQFNSGDTPRVVLNSSGHWVPYADSTYDLGINGTRWRNVYADTLYGDGSNITGIAVTEAPVTDYTISANGSSAYRIHGGGVDETANSPDLYLIRGQKYRFNNTTGSGHPFAIRVSNGGSAYTDGVSGSNQGVQFFTVPYAAPSSLVYQCTIHGGMVGNIYIRGGSSTANISNNADNRIITGGSGGNLNGEANLRFDGSQLEIETSAQNNLKINSSNSDGPNIHFERSGTAFAYLGSAAANTGGTATDLALRAQGNLVFATNGGNARGVIDTNGNFSIGTTSAVNNSGYGGITLNGGSGAIFSLKDSDVEKSRIAVVADNTLSIQSPPGGSGIFRIDQLTADGSGNITGATERLRIVSGGRLFLGTTNAININTVTTGHTFNQVDDYKWILGLRCELTNKVGLAIRYAAGGNDHDAYIFVKNTTVRFRVNGGGDVSNANNSYGQVSDVSLKENIVDASSQWNDIKNLKVRNFNFKSETGLFTRTMMGVVAQEVEEVSPKLVYENEEGLKEVRYSVLYMKSVKALQEAMNRIETLETKITALEGS